MERHVDDVRRVAEVAARFNWSANWTRDVAHAGLALLCLWTQKDLVALTDADFDAFAADLAASPSAGRDARGHNQARLRRVALRYLEVVATTLRASSVLLRADSLIVFCEYLGAHHPDVARLTELDRSAHIEGFLAWNHGRPWRGRVARDKPVALSVSKRTVVDLRSFFDDLAVWDWADRPARRLLFSSDVPRLERPLPRALAPDADRDLMKAIARLDDPFARYALTILRGTGMRLGELLDLELDCLWDFASHGSWVRIPLGKLGTERSLPLDADTLAAFDAWMGLRGSQRALPHPRHGQHVDFLFVERGRRLSDYRLRKGLDDAVASAGCEGEVALRCASPPISCATPTAPA